MAEKQKVLVLGGGFGGIKTALELADSSHYDITLVSDQTNFRYYPMLYHSATGGSRKASSIPLAEIFKGQPVRLIHDEAVKLDRPGKKISSSSGEVYSYDILIVALGVITNFFGIKGLQEYAYGIKSLEEAQRLRDHIHELLVEKQKPDINYVVIGGGPTGVELAGALPGYIHRVMKNHGLRDSVVHVDLVEAESRLLPRMPASYSRAVQKRLRKLGVTLYLDQKVEAETAEALMVSGHSIASHSVVWTAGVTNHPFLKHNDFKLSEHGKAIVDKQLSAEPSICVIGDNADTPFSGMAQTALYDGLFIANNLKSVALGRQTKAYQPKKPIYVTPVGPKWAAVLWGKIQIYGWIGWLLRNAADLIAYHDLEPWWMASQHWLAETESEDACPVCSKRN